MSAQREGERGRGSAVMTAKSVLRTFLSVAMVVLIFFVLKKTIIVRLYPVCVSAVFLCAFGGTLLPVGRVLRCKWEPMVFRLACLSDKTIASSPHKKQIRCYCLKVTAAWCVFFLANGSVALYTALRGSDRLWSVYNGIVSYILMGAMFAVEYIIRKRVMSQLDSGAQAARDVQAASEVQVTGGTQVASSAHTRDTAGGTRYGPDGSAVLECHTPQVVVAQSYAGEGR